MSDELKASVTTGQSEALEAYNAQDAAIIDFSKPGYPQTSLAVKCRVLSISQRYITLETEQAHNLQQGQAITIHAE